MPIVQMPDGTRVDFGNMPDDQIRGLIASKFPQQTSGWSAFNPQGPAAADPNDPWAPFQTSVAPKGQQPPLMFDQLPRSPDYSKMSDAELMHHIIRRIYEPSQPPRDAFAAGR